MKSEGPTKIKGQNPQVKLDSTRNKCIYIITIIIKDILKPKTKILRFLVQMSVRAMFLHVPLNICFQDLFFTIWANSIFLFP